MIRVKNTNIRRGIKTHWGGPGVGGWGITCHSETSVSEVLYGDCQCT